MGKFIIFLILGTLLISGCSMFGENHQGTSINDNIKPGTKIIEKIIIQKDWIFPLLILGGVGGGIFALMLGYRSGIKLMAGAFILISIYLAFVQFHKEIAIAGFIGCMVLLVYIILNVRKTIKENIIGIQKIKEANPDVKTSAGEILSNEQSQTTKDIINKVKYDLKLSELKSEYKEKNQSVISWFKNVVDGFRKSIQSK